MRAVASFTAKLRRSLGCVWLLSLMTGSCLEAKLSSTCLPPECRGNSCRNDVTCTHDDQCPRGSSCNDGVCGVARLESIRTRELIEGFGVREFALTPSTTEGRRTYEVSMPDGAVRVICGLLTCKPRFAREVAGPIELTRLSNAARCVARTDTFDASRASDDSRDFAFEVSALQPSTAACDGEEATSSPSYPVVETLRLGCWAEDLRRVIAATRLVPLNVTDLPDANGNRVANCSDASDGSWCTLAGDIGTCLNGGCDLSRVSSGVPMSAAESGGATNDVTLQLDYSDAPTDCGGLPNDTICRREELESIGQCLSGQCLKATLADYYQPLVVANCDAVGAETDGLNCYPSPVLGYGTCFKRACAIRCRNKTDCMSALDAAGVPCREGGNSGDCEPPRPERCRAVPESYLGVCTN